MRLLQCIMMTVLAACGTEQTAAPQDVSRSDGVEQDDSTGAIHATVMTETLYRVDRVLVVVENGNGPDADRMLDAIRVFRRAATELFELGVLEEYNVWNAIAEIRWRAAPIGGLYDPATASLRLEYHGCIIDPPLYRLLASHYRYELTGKTDLPDTLVQWAEDLSGANTVLCAP